MNAEPCTSRQVRRHARRWCEVLLAAALLAGLLAGCGRSDAEPDEDDGPGASPDEVAAVDEATETSPTPAAEPTEPVLPDTPLPDEHGLYRVDDRMQLASMPTGDASAVHPTNAARGFGFETPRGPVLDDDQPLFVLWAGALELTTLRLTGYAPDSLLPSTWWEPGEAGRSGWLPHTVVELDVERVEGRPGTVRLRPRSALAPGFYVLHDGSLLRARQRDELTAFFPFEVAPAPSRADTDDPVRLGAEHLWLSRASGCLAELENLVIDAHRLDTTGDAAPVGPIDLATVARTHSGRVEQCARRIHAVLTGTDDTEVREQARAALLTLSVIARGVPWDHSRAVLEATDPRFASAPLLSWWLERQALDLALEVRRQIVAGDPGRAGASAARLAALYLDWRSTHGDLGRAGSRALTRLLWIPFFIDARWPALDDVTARLTAGTEAWEAVAILLAAHRAHRLAQFSTRYPDSPLTPVAEATLAALPGEVTAAANGLDTSRPDGQTVHVAGLRGEEAGGPPDSIESRVERWLQGRAKSAARCYDELERRVDGTRQGIVMLDIQIDPSLLGGQARVTVVEPPGASVGERFGDENFTTCLQNRALRDVPATLTTAPVQLRAVLAFDGDRASRTLIR